MRGLGAAVLLGLAIWLSLALLRPPAVVPATAPPAEFSAERAIRHLRVIAREPHPSGSAAHARVRSYLLDQFSALGLQPEVQTATAVLGRWGSPYPAATVHNVVARLKGVGRGKALLLAGHYDSAPVSPGASDDGHSAAVLLETLRALRSGPPLARDVIFLLTDGEEAGLLGAAAFTEQHPWAKEVGLVLNFEARGTSGQSFLFETSEANGRLVREFAHAAPWPSGSSLSYTAYRYLPNDTDLSIFKGAGLAGLNFAYIGEVALYHTPLDDVAHLDLRSLQHQGSYALSLTRHFGNLDLTDLRGPGLVYWSQPTVGFVSYPESWALPVAVAVLAVFGVVGWSGCRLRLFKLSGILWGVLAYLLCAGVSAGVAALLWRVIRGLHPGYEFLAQGDPYNAVFYRVVFVALSAAITTSAYEWLRRKLSMPDLMMGVLFVWLVLAVATSATLPGVSYVFVWPLLFSLLGMRTSFRRGDARLSSIWNWFAALPAVLLIVPVLDLLFVALTIRFAPAPALLTALLAGLVLPLLAPLRVWLPAGAALVCLGCLAAGSMTGGFDAAHPRPDSVWYALDADAGQALWLSMDPRPDVWSGYFLGSRPRRDRLPAFQPLFRSRYLMAPAQAMAIVAPRLQLVEDRTDAQSRTLRLRLISPRSAPVIAVAADAAAEILESSVNGRAIQSSVINLRPAQLARLQSGKQWALRYFAPPPEGIEVMLRAKGVGRLELTVFDLSYGIPVWHPRPPETMPAPFWPDAMVVKASFSF